MQLVAANLVPRADLSRRGRLRHLFQSQHQAVEFLRRRFEFGRNGYVHMMQCYDHSFVESCQKPDREGGQLALADARASDTNARIKLPICSLARSSFATRLI